MAKVSITKDGKTFDTTLSVYNAYFKNSGWRLSDVPAQPSAKAVNKEKAVEQEIADEDWEALAEDEDIEKPISQMNRTELTEKAESLGISTEGKSNKRLREEIKEKM